MKKSELFFSFLQILIDWTAIMSAAALAYWLRHTPVVQELIQKDAIYSLSFEKFMWITLGVSVFVILVFAFEGLYKIRATRRFFSEMSLVTKATTISVVFVMIGFFLQREWFSSRFIIVAAWILTITLVMSGRIITRITQKTLLVKKGIGQHRVLLIGSGQKLKYICNVIQRRPRLGYTVIKHIDHINLKRIKKIRTRFGIDEIIVNESEMPDDLVKKLYDYCQISNITYKLVPSSRQTARFEMTMFGGEPLIALTHTSLDGWGKIAKRFFDCVSAMILTILTAPIIVAVAILIKLEDPDGPVIFKNKRIGANGKEFNLYKFRYMKWKWCTTKSNPDWEDAMHYEKKLIEKQSARTGPVYKIFNDPRRTKIGRFIERFSIDEFPQLFNVLRGEMSLVGPRPHQEREVEKYRAYHRRLLTIKPGMTGMAQVSGRSDLDFEDEYRLDVYYIENWSLWLDIIIMIKTGPAVLRSRKNAERICYNKHTKEKSHTSH